MDNQHQYKPQLVMYRTTLTELQPVQLPTGYELRTFKPGDEGTWESIINQSFKYESNFEREMAGDEYFKPERLLFICHEGIPVATAAAWYRPAWGENTGYLHMVGALPSHGGKGLGLQVSLAALHQMRKEGRVASVLETDDFRIPAIKSYLKLGYKPLIVHENQGKRWHDIFSEHHLDIT